MENIGFAILVILGNFIIFRDIYMVVSETEYRQRKLDDMVKKYHEGKYDRYFFDGENIIVFEKRLKTRIKQNCFNIKDLDLKLNDL